MPRPCEIRAAASAPGARGSLRSARARRPRRPCCRGHCRAVLEPKNLTGLREVSEQRVIARVLGVMGVEAAQSPRDLAAGADHGAVDVNRQSAQIELLNLLIEQFTVDPRQRTQ